jgi:hypothetical protein
VPKQTIVSDLMNLLTSEEYADVTFIVGGDKRFKAHKCIIANRCEVFYNMFAHGM